MKECTKDIQYTEWILELMEEEVLDPYHDWHNNPDYENVVKLDLDIRVSVLGDVIVHKIKARKVDKSNPIYLSKLVEKLMERCENIGRHDLVAKLYDMKLSLEGI